MADFGVALAIPHLPFVQAVKQRKADRYLAPEYVQGSEVDQRADLYSLGVIIGEMLTGLTPDGAIPELVRRNPEVPPQLEGLYRKALKANGLSRSGGIKANIDALAKRHGVPELPTDYHVLIEHPRAAIKARRTPAARNRHRSRSR